MTTTTPERRVQRVRHELKRRDLEVVAIDALSPGFVRITFAGESLADFASDSFDDHVKLLFQDKAGDVIGRDYTPRAFDRQARRLQIEFAMHGDGVADRWVRQAQIGQRLAIGGPRGSMVVPMDYDWHVLVGDLSALPAIQRRLDELPDTAHAMVIVQAPAGDRRPLTARAGVTVQWVDTTEALVGAVQRLSLPDGDGFVWAAGEASVMKQLRTLLLTDKQHPREAMKVAAYWKHGAAGHHEKLDD